MTLREQLLSLGLAVSLVAAILLYVERFSDPRCDDSNRYLSEKGTGCKEILLTEANPLIENYCKDHCKDTRYTVTGFNISKRAIDQIFNDTKLNTISTDLVYDSYNKGMISLVIRGNYLANTKLESLPTPSNVFIVKSVCPFDCSVVCTKIDSTE